MELSIKLGKNNLCWICPPLNNEQTFSLQLTDSVYYLQSFSPKKTSMQHIWHDIKICRLDSVYMHGQSNPAGRQAGRQEAGARTGFPRTDVGLETARVS